MKISYMRMNYKIYSGLYVSLIVLLAVLPLNASRMDNVSVLSLRGDYWVHILQFIPSMPIFLKRWQLAVSLIFSISLALITEGIQFWLPYRAFNINDLVANGLGIMLSFFFVIILAILKSFLGLAPYC
jgi:hypothetical protein